MSSNSKKTERIRARKHKPNKANLKKNQKRIRENARILKELAEAQKS